MKLLVLILVFVTSLSTQAAGDLGVGAMLGVPTGITAKKKLYQSRMVDGAMGWAFGRNTHLLIQGSYLWNYEKSIYLDNQPLDTYWELVA
jgi:hypothetical protein